MQYNGYFLSKSRQNRGMANSIARPQTLPQKVWDRHMVNNAPGDVYELIDAPTSAIVRMFDAAVVLTCGWAAPIDRSDQCHDDDDADGDDDDDASEKVPPSQHPQRRRVRLVVVVGDQGVGSVLRFADAPKEIVTDAGSARGSLADAVNNLWFDSPVNVARTNR